MRILKISGAFLWLAVLAVWPCALVQGQQPGTLPADIVGPPLIAWSELQRPQPIPDFSPLFDLSRRKEQPEQKRRTAIELSGTIIKDGSVYVLQLAKSRYPFKEQERAVPYEGKDVRIVCTVEPATEALDVLAIETLQ